MLEAYEAYGDYNTIGELVQGAAVAAFGSTVITGADGSEDQQGRVPTGHLVPVVGEREHFPVLAHLGQVGVGLDQGVSPSVFGEEGKHRVGTLRATRH